MSQELKAQQAKRHKPAPVSTTAHSSSSGSSSGSDDEVYIIYYKKYTTEFLTSGREEEVENVRPTSTWSQTQLDTGNPVLPAPSYVCTPRQKVVSTFFHS